MKPTYREKNILDYLFGGFRSTLKWKRPKFRKKILWFAPTPLWPNTRVVKYIYCVSQKRNEANDKRPSGIM